ncbi:Methyltransferase FkbM [Trinorchestia longiramus]|nr:Methyltransferase FkbM [Trinorchestia longiramus]
MALMNITHLTSKRARDVALNIKCLISAPQWQCAAFYSRIAALAVAVVVVLVMVFFSISGFASTPHYSVLIPSCQVLIPPRQVLIPPSTLPYALEGRRNIALNHVHTSETFYKNATQLIFNNTREGIFVEAGALDGETMSNTLGLEKTRGWSGLLVEAEKVAFSQLQQKHRRAWLANICLSPTAYPSMELFATKSSHLSVASTNFAGFKHRAMGKLQRYRLNSNLLKSTVKQVQCIPLSTLLLALNFKRVDLLVLDVEGAEMDIIRTLDFTFFDIQVIFLEWKDLSKHREVSEEIKKKGYRLVLHLTEDFVFLKKKTEYDAVLPGVNLKLGKS